MLFRVLSYVILWVFPMGTTSKNRTGILIILDGFGVNPDPRFNAVAQAATPTLNRLLKTYPHGEIQASESYVGLPNGFMGNSEVGHLNLGAGRVVFQDFSLISRAIDDGSFFHNPIFLGLFEELKKQTKPTRALHLMGLVSDGGVHSHLSHLFALLQLAKREGIERVYVHAFMDGRDTSPTGGIEYLRKLTSYCEDLKVGKIATIQGRFFAMDRDNRWERIHKAYDAIFSASAEMKFEDPLEFMRACYDRRLTDEFIPPAVGKGFTGVQDGDGIIFFNFRADRARQITRAITQNEFTHFRREHFSTLSGFVAMTPYDDKMNLSTAFGKPKVPDTLGEVVSRQGWKQLRIAETEKYAHVTYFFNGGEEKVFDGEKRILVPSPREVKTYDLKPEMAAGQVTELLLKELATGEYKFVVVNFANPDMVGHTGNLSAAIRAVETVDACLGKIVAWVEANDAFALLTADHGNCEKMLDEQGQPFTAHTLLPVPLVLIDPQAKEATIATGGSLCDIAPTLLRLWGLDAPREMTGKNLVLPS